ncbi:MAG: HAD-IC family P-type ATPase [bacterium]|nr:HAD-IC family P-type ATPase [bacterium]
MKISSFLEQGLTTIHLQSTSKDAVLKEMVAMLHKQRHIKNPEAIAASIIDREKIVSTAVGNGIAIPHARIEGLDEMLFFVGVSSKGIDFNAPDNKPVHLFFLFITPLSETGTHLKILSKISLLAQDKILINKMISAESDEKLLRLIKSQQTEREEFLSLSREEIYQELNTGDNGLSIDVAKQRLEDYGHNELSRKKGTPLILRFLCNFTNLLALLMWAGSMLAFFIGMKEVGWTIIVVIVLNALFSFWQEFKAERAIEALTVLMPRQTRILRDGKEHIISSSDIVPGDITLFEEGDNIPADARLIESHELRVDNSIFSGESRPGYKMSEGFNLSEEFAWTEIPNLVFAGTSVVSGTGKAVVIATGMATELGKIANLTQSVKEEPSPLQKEIDRLTKIIAVIAVSLGLIFFILGTFVAKLSYTAAAMFAIGIILGNVPEGLMPTVTLSLAVAVQRMSKRHVLVKKLSSVETLGSTDVICTDKTGTLTTSQVCVKKLWLNGKIIEVSGIGYEPSGEFSSNGKAASKDEFEADNLHLFSTIGILCSTARLIAPGREKKEKYWNVLGDPTEGALLSFAVKAGLDIDKTKDTFPLINRFPFESVRKRMSSIHQITTDRVRAFVKGSPRDVLSLSTSIVYGDKIVPLSDDDREQIMTSLDTFAASGLRVLALAYRDYVHMEAIGETAEQIECNLTFVGLTAMHDPPRPEVADAIALCKKAGIRIVMITGDYEITALAIARQVGIVESQDVKVINGTTLTSISDEDLQELLKDEVVFARVNPEHKFRIVNAFKEIGHIVAVTGDGVNDAPALKRADIGIAMGVRGTDVARDAADMILTDDNFASIVAGIEEGRAVFDNIRKFMTYIFAHLVPEVIPFCLYAIFRIPFPITALQILAIDLGTETLPAIALGTEKIEEGLMNMPPRPKNKGLIDSSVLFRGYFFLGILSSIAVLAAYFWVLFKGGWSPGMQLETDDTLFTNPLHLHAMTMIFAGIVVMQIANVFACRTEFKSVFTKGLFSNRLIIWGIAFELVFIVALVYIPFFQKIFNTVPLTWADWGILFVFMIAIFFIEEGRKRLAAINRQT